MQGSLDCRVLMHYFWPTSPLTQPGHAAAPPSALFPTAASRLPVWGSNPANPDNLCGQKVLAFGADRTELVPTANVACGLTAAQVWNPVSNPAGERCGIADFMRAVFGVTVTPDAPNGKGRLAIDNVGVQYKVLAALQRGEITAEQFVDLNAKVGGIDIDGNFVGAPDRGRSGRAADRLRDRPRQQRHRRRARSRDRQPHRRPDGRHGLPSGLPVVLLPRAPGPCQRPPRQPGDLALAHRWGGAEPVRRDAPVAGHGRQAHARRLLHGGRRARAEEPDMQRHVAPLRLTADRGRRAALQRCRQVPAEAARALSRARRSFSDAQWDTLQAAFPTGVCDYSLPGVETAAAQGPLADVRRRAGRPRARRRARRPRRSSSRRPSAGRCRPRCR